MILAAGLSPAWQQILSFRHFNVGEVNRANFASWCASGKVLNVGYALHRLGASAKILSLVGGNPGIGIRRDFEQLGVPVRWIDSCIPTRTCTTILDETTGLTTELIENCSRVPDCELQSFFDAFIDEVRIAQVVVLSGSLPEGTPPDFFSRLLKQTNSSVILDIRGPELDLALPLRPFLVKPNREELSKTVGRPIHTDQDLIAAMSEIRNRGAEWVVVSQGPAPLFALGPEGLWQITPPEVKVRNPIGCGDCLAAGIAVGIDRQLPMRRSLEIGIRAAAENAEELLPARNLTRLV